MNGQIKCDKRTPDREKGCGAGNSERQIHNQIRFPWRIWRECGNVLARQNRVDAGRQTYSFLVFNSIASESNRLSIEVFVLDGDYSNYVVPLFVRSNWNNWTFTGKLILSQMSCVCTMYVWTVSGEYTTNVFQKRIVIRTLWYDNDVLTVTVVMFEWSVGNFIVMSMSMRVMCAYLYPNIDF